MKIEECKSRNNWKSNHSQKQSQFLQSWEWGEFKQSLGKDVLRLQLKQGDSVVTQAQGIIHELVPGLTYAYFPRIPIQACTEELFGHLQDKVAFCRVEPDNNKQVELDTQLSFEKYDTVDSHSRQPKNTLVLNLDSSEEDLLEDMHSKTRYNIRLSDRKGVEVKKEQDLNIFYKLQKETEERAGFSGHPKNYYEKMLELDSSYQLIAYFQGEPLASNILIESNDTMTYLHGASTRKHSDVMATYKIQWEGIRLAKDRGCSYYDFWGSAPVYDEEEIEDMSGYDKSFGKCWPEDHSLSGVTRFKVRFNPKPISYPPAKDVILGAIRYNFYSIARKLREFL
ncbi:MAG: lipid II:glycine glycyltransferase FemX [Candidatus Magasanikbacteria bacterium]